jgi:hypothetical protein
VYYCGKWGGAATDEHTHVCTLTHTNSHIPRYANNTNFIGGHFEFQDGCLYQVSQYLTINWGISVCLSVCLCVCLSVCLSGYTFPQCSTDLLQVWRETFYGSWAIYVVCAHNARACACSAHVFRLGTCIYFYYMLSPKKMCDKMFSNISTYTNSIYMLSTIVNT